MNDLRCRFEAGRSSSSLFTKTTLLRNPPSSCRVFCPSPALALFLNNNGDCCSIIGLIHSCLSIKPTKSSTSFAVWILVGRRYSISWMLSISILMLLPSSRCCVRLIALNHGLIPNRCLRCSSMSDEAFLYKDLMRRCNFFISVTLFISLLTIKRSSNSDAILNGLSDWKIIRFISSSSFDSSLFLRFLLLTTTDLLLSSLIILMIFAIFFTFFAYTRPSSKILFSRMVEYLIHFYLTSNKYWLSSVTSIFISWLS